MKLNNKIKYSILALFSSNSLFAINNIDTGKLVELNMYNNTLIEKYKFDNDLFYFDDNNFKLIPSKNCSINNYSVKDNNILSSEEYIKLSNELKEIEKFYKKNKQSIIEKKNNDEELLKLDIEIAVLNKNILLNEQLMDLNLNNSEVLNIYINNLYNKENKLNTNLIKNKLSIHKLNLKKQEIEGKYNKDLKILTEKYDEQKNNINKKMDEFLKYKNYKQIEVKRSCKKESLFVESQKNILIPKNNYFKISNNNNSINISQDLKITNNTKQDWDNISINYHNCNYKSLIKPIEFNSIELNDFYLIQNGFKNIKIPIQPISSFNKQKESKLYSKAIQRNMDMVSTNSLEEVSVSHIENSTKSSIKIDNISAKINEEINIPIMNKEYKSNCFIEIDGYSNSIPFLKCKINSDIYIPYNKFDIELDNININNDYMEIKKGENIIYFGEDKFIDVKKELIEKHFDESFNKILSNDTYTLKWKYIIQNNHNNDKNIELKERIPKIIDDKFKLKYNFSIKPKNINKDNGEIIFDLNLKPKEKIEIIYEIIVEKK